MEKGVCACSAQRRGRDLALADRAKRSDTRIAGTSGSSSAAARLHGEQHDADDHHQPNRRPQCRVQRPPEPATRAQCATLLHITPPPLHARQLHAQRRLARTRLRQRVRGGDDRVAAPWRSAAQKARSASARRRRRQHAVAGAALCKGTVLQSSSLAAAVRRYSRLAHARPRRLQDVTGLTRFALLGTLDA